MESSYLSWKIGMAESKIRLKLFLSELVLLFLSELILFLSKLILLFLS